MPGLSGETRVQIQTRPSHCNKEPATALLNGRMFPDEIYRNNNSCGFTRRRCPARGLPRNVLTPAASPATRGWGSRGCHNHWYSNATKATNNPEYYSRVSSHGRINRVVGLQFPIRPKVKGLVPVVSSKMQHKTNTADTSVQ
ncbi:hypothetical protein J6590_048012 [Homalodisca vitripennis]|nr:hypothetical protein J6590_048012 [Homalodisca vitripennis]